MILGKSFILENIRSPEGRCDSISTRGPIVFSCVLDMGLKNFGHLTNILLGWPFFYPLKWFVLAGRTDWTDSVKKGPSLFSHYNIKHYSYRLNYLSKKDRQISWGFWILVMLEVREQIQKHRLRWIAFESC